MAREAAFVVWAAVSMSSTGQGVRAVEQGLTGSSAAGGGVTVQGERGRVPAMVGERGVLPALLGERGIQHGVGGGHAVLGEHGGVRVLLDERGGLHGVGAGLPVLGERGGLPMVLEDHDGRHVAAGGGLHIQGERGGTNMQEDDAKEELLNDNVGMHEFDLLEIPVPNPSMQWVGELQPIFDQWVDGMGDRLVVQDEDDMMNDGGEKVVAEADGVDEVAAEEDVGEEVAAKEDGEMSDDDSSATDPVRGLIVLLTLPTWSGMKMMKLCMIG